MRVSKSARLGAFVLCLGASAVLVGTATNATGAFFSDSQQGNFSGTLGSIKIDGNGGNDGPLGFHFNNMLPGEPQTATITFRNTGTSNEDVWIKFNNPAALAALNDLGTYGEVHIKANGTPIFDSANLNDDKHNSCGPLSPAGCWPLPSTLKLFSNVGPLPGGTGQITFTFNYAGKLGNTGEGGVVINGSGGQWNSYPLGSPTAAGLPFQLVATQVGQLP